jgi:hypothetical protein
MKKNCDNNFKNMGTKCSQFHKSGKFFCSVIVALKYRRIFTCYTDIIQYHRYHDDHDDDDDGHNHHHRRLGIYTRSLGVHLPRCHLILKCSKVHPGNGFPPQTKQPDHEADHSFLSRANIKIAWRIPSTPPIHIHGAVIRQKGTPL